MQIRPHQSAVIDGARKEVMSGKRSPLIVLPTGAGKTVTASEIVRSKVAKGGRVAWMAHRDELITQARQTLERFGLSVGANGFNAGAPVQIVSVQTAVSRGEAPDADLVVFDEAHHFVADKWKALPDVYRGKIMIGLTATPERADGVGLGSVFDSLVPGATIKELQALGYLTMCEVMAPKKAVPNSKLALEPVDAYLRYANGTSAIVFAPHVQAAADFCDGFNRKNVKAAVVHGTMSEDERFEVLHRFACGEIRVLCNVYILTEGWDCPRAKTCILARKVGSAGAYLQMTGRVLRPWQGTTAKLIDLHGSTVEAYGPPDEDREYSLDGRGIRRKGMQGEQFCKLHGIPIVDGVCSECGSKEATELVTPTAAGIDLGAWKKIIQQDNDLVRAKRLRKWFELCRIKGYKKGFAYGKYKGTYGSFPPPGIVAAATMKEIP